MKNSFFQCDTKTKLNERGTRVRFDFQPATGEREGGGGGLRFLCIGWELSLCSAQNLRNYNCVVCHQQMDSVPVPRSQLQARLRTILVG